MIIYKYLNEEGALKTLENNSVLLNTPLDYNDPFDCWFYVSKKEKKKAYKLMANYFAFESLYTGLFEDNKELVLGKANTKLLKKNIQYIINSIKKNKKYKFDPYIHIFYYAAKAFSGKNDDELKQEFEKQLDETFKKAKRSLLLSCFSLRNDSILMWSHYAESHTGICLKYEIEDKNFGKVKYTKRKKTFELTKLLELVLGYDFLNIEIDEEDKTFLFVVKPLFAKSKEWKYEKEVRCAYSLNKLNSKIHKEIDEKGKEIFLLDMPPIRTIYVGCNAKEDFVKKVKSLSGDIPIMKMEKRKDEYGLAATDLDSNK